MNLLGAAQSAGYENAHGRFEYVPIQSMVKNVEILLNIVNAYANSYFSANPER